MGIVRTAEWRLACPPLEATELIKRAFATLDMTAVGDSGSLRAKSERSLRKNRWAAEVELSVDAIDGGTIVHAKVDMLGNKHDAVLNEVRSAIAAPSLTDVSRERRGYGCVGSA